MTHFEAYLKNKGITIKEFYQDLKEKYPDLNITRSMLSYIKRGVRYPSPKLALRMSQATNGELTCDNLIYPPKRLKEFE